jgi:hypothetical protein
MQTLETTLTNLVRVVATTQQTLNTIATESSIESGGVTPKYYESAATTNATSVQASSSTLFNVIIVNTTATKYYFKLYNKASAPTVGTDVPLQSYEVAASGTLNINYNIPLAFSTGLAFALTAGFAISDNTAAVTGIGINLGYR